MKKPKQVFHAILEDNEDRAERRGGPRRVWIRYRSKLKGVPLEYVRLAALEQVESSKVCKQALQEVEKELQGGRPKVEEMVEPEVANPDPPVLEFSGDEEDESAPVESPPASNLDDVPAQLHRDHRPFFLASLSWSTSAEEGPL